MEFADIVTPDTPAARAARELAGSYHTPALVNHCVRSWLWAVGFAQLDGIEHVDHELLYVAALLHDIGLVTAFDNHTLAFEDAGGHVAVALTTGAGWTPDRRRRVHDVIERHMWASVDPAMDAEGYLLEVATSLDISGARADDLPLAFRMAVVAAHPRLDLAAEFGAHIVAQAARKPASSSQRLLAAGVAAKLAANPLETLH